MENKIKQIFEAIHAEEELKQKTAHFLEGEINKTRKKRQAMFYGKTAVVCLFLLIFLGFYKMYYTGDVYIDLDINPSFELKVNRFHKVIDVLAYNEDGSEVLKQADINNMTYMDAVRLLLQKMQEKGFLKKNGLLSVSVQSSDQSREENTMKTLELLLAEIAQADGIETDVFTVSREVREQAHKNRLSAVKYLAILELQEFKPSVTIEECRGHSVSEIRQWIKECSHGMKDDGHHKGRCHE